MAEYNSKKQRRAVPSRMAKRVRTDTNNAIVAISRMILCNRDEEEIRDMVKEMYPEWAATEKTGEWGEKKFAGLYQRAMTRCKQVQNKSVEQLIKKNTEKLDFLLDEAFEEKNYNLYLRGLELLQKMNPQNNKNATIMTKDAIIEVSFDG